jgi:hypothetical protein
VHLAGGGGHGVVVLHDGADEAAGGEIGAGARGGLGGHGAVVVGAFGGGVEIGVSGDVVVIDMDAVVGNEGAARRAIGLGVDVLAEAVDRGQQRSLGLFGVLAREQRFDIGVEGLLAVFLRALHGVLEGEAQGRGGVRRGLGPGGAGEEREGSARDRQEMRHRCEFSIEFGR